MRRAFTLIELLVVIAIIAILAGMVLGGVSLVKASARRLACGNNLRQISLGVLAYAQEQEGLLPGGRTPPWDVLITPLLDGTGWLRCPEDHRSGLTGLLRSYVLTARTSTGARHDGLIEEPSTPGYPTLVMSQISRPGDTVLATEAYTDSTGAATTGVYASTGFYVIRGWLNVGSIPLRAAGAGYYHGSTTTFVFADGHQVAQAPATVYAGYPASESQWKGMR